MSDYQLNDTVHLLFTTRQFSDGVPTVLAGTPLIDIYEDATATPIVTGETLVVDLNTVAGLNAITITATSGTGFNADGTYHAVIQQGTVGGVSVVGEVVGTFTIEKDSINWAKVAAPTTAVDLSATDFQLVDTAAAVTTVNGLAANVITAAATAADHIDLIWDETLAGHVTADTTGLLLNDWQDAGRLDAILDIIAADVVNIDGQAMRGTNSALLAADINLTAGAVDLVTTTTNLTTNNDKTGYALSAAGVDLIWDETLAGHVTADTTGLLLNDWQNAGRLDLILDIIAVDVAGLSGAAMRGTDDAALATALTTAQNDLDILTGADGVNLLSTTQTSIDAIETDTNSLNDGAISEIAQGVPSATPTLQNAVMLMYMALRNKLDVQTSGTDALELHNNAGTQIAIKLLTDDGSDYSEARMTTGV